MTVSTARRTSDVTASGPRCRRPPRRGRGIASTAGVVAVTAFLLHGCGLGSSGTGHVSADGLQLSAAERSSLDVVVQQTLESRVSGESGVWRGASRSISAVVTPIRTYPAADTFCREYEVVVSLGADTTTSRRTACREDGGIWSVHAG